MTIGRLGGADGAEFGDGHLVVGEGFEQEGFEGFVGAVDLIDQQDGRAARLRLHGLQKRPADQETLGEELLGQRVAVGGTFGFGGADRNHLGGEIPFIDSTCGVQALVALQADQAAAERLRQGPGDLGLADPGLAFEEERPAELQGEEDDGRRPRPAT